MREFAPHRRGAVLITGGSGFIGRHLTTTLLGAGYRVSILDPIEPLHLAQGIRWTCGSVSDRAAVLKAIEDVEIVVNLAGVSALHQAEQTVWEVNANGTAGLARTAAESGVAQFVHISTDAVYGPRVGDGAASESRHMTPSGPYGESKAAGEEAVRRLIRLGALRGLVLRPFSVVGPGQKIRPLGTPLLAAALEAATTGAPLRIEGDGEQTRDFVSIADLQATVLAAIGDRITSDAPVNVGSGCDASINMFVNLVEQATGRIIKRSWDRSASPASGWRANNERANGVFPGIVREPLATAIRRACGLTAATATPEQASVSKGVDLKWSAGWLDPWDGS